VNRTVVVGCGDVRIGIGHQQPTIAVDRGRAVLVGRPFICGPFVCEAPYLRHPAIRPCELGIDD
jgi:hypothetical protein